MKQSLAAIVLATTSALLSSCAAPMISPVAPWATRATADWAAGAWVSDNLTQTTNQGGIVGVEFLPDGRCMVQYRQTGGSSDVPVALDLEARLFELKGKLFADVTLPIEKMKELSHKYACFIVPTHVLVRVDKQADGSAVIRMASYAEAAKMAKDAKTPLAAQQYGDVEEISVLTGNSQEITKFFEANAANDDLFSLKLRFVRPK